MIRVRYRGSNELSPGLHATAERDGRRTTVYLLDGMTAVQRRSALRRLRLTARMGHCPRLPAAQLAFALFTDRIRTGIGRAGRVLRLHPAGSTVPIMVLSGGAIAFLLFSTVSIHVIRPGAAGQSAAGTSPVASASPIATGEGSRGQATGQGGPGAAGNQGDPGGTGALADPGGLGGGSDPRQLTQPGRGSSGRTPALAADGGGGGTGTGSGSGGNNGTSRKSSGGGTTLSGGAGPSQLAPRPSTPAASAPASAPASTPSATAPAQSGSGSGSGSSSGSGPQGSGVCVNVGPLGVCLNI
jgi:hypothetical protein